MLLLGYHAVACKAPTRFAFSGNKACFAQDLPQFSELKQATSTRYRENKSYRILKARTSISIDEEEGISFFVPSD